MELISKRTLEQRLGRSEGLRHGDGTGKSSRSRRNSKYRGLRQEHAQCDRGTVRQPVWAGCSEGGGEQQEVWRHQATGKENGESIVGSNNLSKSSNWCGSKA